VKSTRTILTAFILALALAVSIGWVAESGTAFAASNYVSNAASHSCDGPNPLHDHGHNCHNVARHHSASLQRPKPNLQPLANLNSFAFLVIRRLVDNIDEIEIGQDSGPPLGAKTPFLAVFKYKTSLLF